MTYRYSVTTLDPRATWWCGHFRAWFGGDDWPDGTRVRYDHCTHRHFRTFKQAKAHAAALVMRGIVDVFILAPRGRPEWGLAVTVPGDGAPAEPSIAWARAYLALPRRKR